MKTRNPVDGKTSVLVRVLLALAVGLLVGLSLGFFSAQQHPFRGLDAEGQQGILGDLDVLDSSEMLEFEVAGAIGRGVELLSLLRIERPEVAVAMLEGSLDSGVISIWQQRDFADLPTSTRQALEKAKAYRNPFPTENLEAAVEDALQHVPDRSAELAAGTTALASLLQAKI